MRMVLSNDVVRIATSGRATQLVLFGHGGYEEAIKWKPAKGIFKGRWKKRKTDGYGFFETPIMIYFYTYQGNFTSGSGGFLEAMNFAGGWRTRKGTVTESVAVASAGVQELMRSGHTKTAIDASAASPKGQGKKVTSIVPPGSSVWNYSISAFKPAEKANLQQIENIRKGAFPPDLDLAYLHSGSMHLDEIIEKCMELDETESYDLLHYLPCRFAGAMTDKYTA